MSTQVKTSATRLSAAHLSQRLHHCGEVFQADPRFKTTPITPVVVGATADRLDAAVKDVFEARRILKIRVQAKTDSLKAAQQAYTVLGAYVFTISNGDKALIAEAGLDVRNPPAPLPIPAQPESLVTRASKKPGEARLRWGRVAGSKGYHIERSTNPTDPGGWVRIATQTRASLDVENLPSGARVWFRVAAIGTRGDSPFSDTVSCMPA